MKCQYCSYEAAEGQKFCMRCGTRLELKPEPEQESVWPVCDEEKLEAAQLHDDMQLPEEPEHWDAPPVPKAAPVPMAPPVQPEPVVKKVWVSAAPVLKLPTERGLGKMIFLGLVTLGIYPVVIWSRIVTELNIAASRYDGKRTVPYFGAGMLSGITLGIYAWVWMHNFCNRIGDELNRRNIDYSFGARTFWLWGMLGSLIIVGPFVFTHKLMKSMNLINADFNEKG